MWVQVQITCLVELYFVISCNVENAAVSLQMQMMRASKADQQHAQL